MSLMDNKGLKSEIVEKLLLSSQTLNTYNSDGEGLWDASDRLDKWVDQVSVALDSAGMTAELESWKWASENRVFKPGNTFLDIDGTNYRSDLLAMRAILTGILAGLKPQKSTNMNDDLRQSCITCHFLAISSNFHKFEVAQPTRDQIQRQDYSNLTNWVSLECYCGIWSEGHNLGIDRRHEIIVETDREGTCFFWQYRPGMLFPAAKELQAREANVRASPSADKGGSVPVAAAVLAENYVDPKRISELRTLASARYDLTKLIRLCEELNQCYAAECYLATAMLVRAIQDHVPPIFELSTFSEVSSNYGGAKSFKQSMRHLDNSLRYIADHQLHVQIRSKEVLPMRTQVDFRADLDMLLSEIVRLLK